MSERERLIELLKAADESSARRCITDYNEAIADNADYLLEHGVIVLPPNVRPVVRAVRERICNQFLVSKETRIQWSEQETLCSEEEAERMAHEFINDWDKKWNRRAGERGEV